ncbi:MAG TPA: DUF2306 domain-containing protein [Variovorax sp.]|nr:DUF2306 domain-containing protein [Variovorax sp.]
MSSLDRKLRGMSLPSRVLLVFSLTVVCLLVARFLGATLQKYIHVDAATYGMFWTRRTWLWMHIGGGTLAMLLGPTQWLSQMPRAWPRLHRWIGRAYFVGILVACAGAAALIATTPAGLAFQLAFGSTALAWLSTGLIALVAIRRKHTQAHRRWMLRNYIVTLSPITFRLALPGAIPLAPPDVLIPTLLWLSWLLPLGLLESGRWIGKALRRGPIRLPSGRRA